MKRSQPAWIGSLLAVSFALGACSHGSSYQLDELAPAAAEQPYTVRPGDVLRIRVWPDSALGGDYPVEDDGIVNLPGLGAMDVAGMELGALRGQLRDAYGTSLKAPAVSITPIFSVSVLGAVQRPGLYQVDPSQNLFDAISLAGGFRPDAKEDEVKVVRNGRVIPVNAEAALEQGAPVLALALRSGDRVIVPRGNSIRLLDIFYGLQSLVLVISLVTRL